METDIARMICKMASRGDADARSVLNELQNLSDDHSDKISAAQRLCGRLFGRNQPEPYYTDQVTQPSTKPMRTYHAYAAANAKAPLEPFSFDPGDLHPEEVEIKVSYCGICHSDLSMLDNEWGMSKYPFVPGHEVAAPSSRSARGQGPEDRPDGRPRLVLA